MANQYTRPGKSVPYIAPVSLDLLGKTLLNKQEKIDQNYLTVQSALDQYNQYDILREEDRQYLHGKVDEIVSQMNNLNGIDLTDQKSVMQLQQMASVAAKDERIIKARRDTELFRKDQAILDMVKTNPKLMKYYSVSNEHEWSKNLEGYLKGEKDSVERFRLNTAGEKLKEVFKSVKPQEYSELVRNGYFIRDNKVVSLESLKNSAAGLYATDPDVRRQIETDYNYWKDTSLSKPTVEQLFTNKDLNINQLQEQRNKLNIEYSTPGISPEYKKQLESEISKYDNKIKSEKEDLKSLRDKFNKGEDIEDFVRKSYLEEYFNTIASPYVVQQSREKVNTAQLALDKMNMSNEQFNAKFNQTQKYQDNLIRLREEKLKLDKESLSLKSTELNSGRMMQLAYDPVTETSEDKTERLKTYATDQHNQIQNELRGTVSNLAMEIIQRENPQLAIKIKKNKQEALLSSELLNKDVNSAEKKFTQPLSTAELELVTKTLSRLEEIQKSDSPVIPKDLKEFLPEIKRLKEAQVRAEWIAETVDDNNWGTPQEMQEFERMEKAIASRKTQTQSPIIGGSMSQLGVTRISDSSLKENPKYKKLKEKRDNYIATKTKLREDRFGTIQIPSSFPVPIEDKEFNDPTSQKKAYILRSLVNNGVTESYNSNKKFAINNQIMGKSGNLEVGKDYTDTLEGINTNETIVKEVRTDGKVKVELFKGSGKEKVSAGEYVVDLTRDRNVKKLVGEDKFTNTDYDLNSIIRSKGGAVGKDGKLVTYNLSSIDPDIDINLPYNILSASDGSIVFEFFLPNGTKVRTPKFTDDYKQLESQIVYNYNNTLLATKRQNPKLDPDSKEFKTILRDNFIKSLQ